jgi:caffeoyl-CoA O-methyltransferase
LSKQILKLSELLHTYLLENSLREPEVLTKLRGETAKRSEANMQISPEQGQFMALLVKLMAARKIIEVGTFTGYSSIAMAQSLPDDGLIICCDLSWSWTAVAREYWQKAGVDNKVDLRLAPALSTMNLLIEEGWDDFDIAFIDADKENYLHYYEAALKLLRPGGLIMVDNVLWGGDVVDEKNQEPSTEAIRAFNRFVHQDERVDISLVPIGDGLSLLRKR